MVGRFLMLGAIPISVLAAAGGHVLAGSQRTTAGVDTTASACQSPMEMMGRHGAGQANPTNGFAALLVSGVSGNTITGTSRGQQTLTVTVSSTTTYSEDGVAGSLSDVSAGTRIFVCGTSNGANAFQATGVVIMLPHLGGVVTAVTAPSLSVTTFNGVSQTLLTDARTVFDRAGQKVSFADLSTGAAIQAAYRPASDGSLTAVHISIVLPHLQGKVSGVSGTTITLNGRNATVYTVITTPNTTYTAPGGGTATADSVKAGVFISAEGTLSPDGKTLTASRITVMPAGGFGHGRGGGFGKGPGDWGGRTHGLGGMNPAMPLGQDMGLSTGSV